MEPARRASGYDLFKLIVAVILLILFLILNWRVIPPSPRPISSSTPAPLTPPGTVQTPDNKVTVIKDYKHDVSPPLRDLKPKPIRPEHEHEANINPHINSGHQDLPDLVLQGSLLGAGMPGPVSTFDGISYPGVGFFSAPPDVNGEAGLTQYAQIANEGFQVFNKRTGRSVLGPISISTIWSGFSGVCEMEGGGDPVILYDQLAQRWLVSQFAGSPVPTDECLAVSTSSDATGSYFRYGFHLGPNLFDYPHLGVWPDAYYLAMNVYRPADMIRLGPQPFAFDRTAMLAGASATAITTGITGGALEDLYLPADLDGFRIPPAGAPNSFVEWPGSGTYKIYHFHVDFNAPRKSRFSLFARPAAAGFTALCPTTRACVPQPNGSFLDAVGDRLMFRLAYRNFGDHESLVTNYTVRSRGVAGIRWIELRNITRGPVRVFQESTYQPDATWRWMGSAAMDRDGNLALAFSVSSPSVMPGLRYAGRLASDPRNTLAQGEAVLFAGAGSQAGTETRWGDYSDLTVDPVDDCTFWYTSEYFPEGSSPYWRTHIGSFKFPRCGLTGPTPTGTLTPTASATPTPTGTQTPAVTHTPTNTPQSPTPTATLSVELTFTPTPETPPVTACEAAFSRSHLQKGMNATIVQRLNFRSSPGIGNNWLLTNTPGTKVEVVGGPECIPHSIGAYVWWQIKLPNGQIGWSAEASRHGAFYFMEPIR